MTCPYPGTGGEGGKRDTPSERVDGRRTLGKLLTRVLAAGAIEWMSRVETGDSRGT